MDSPLVRWCECESAVGKTSYDAVRKSRSLCLLLADNDIVQI